MTTRDYPIPAAELAVDDSDRVPESVDILVEGAPKSDRLQQWGPLTVYRHAEYRVSAENARKYRWWRATLNQHAVQRLTTTKRSADELLAELTLFVGLVRRSNWIVIDELNMAYLNAAWLFGVQLVVWIVALLWVIM